MRIIPIIFIATFDSDFEQTAKSLNNMAEERKLLHQQVNNLQLHLEVRKDLLSLFSNIQRLSVCKKLCVCFLFSAFYCIPTKVCKNV